MTFMGSYFLTTGTEPSCPRVPVSLLALHRMVLSGQIGPTDPIADSPTSPPRPLRERPELIPSRAFRKRVLRLYRERREREALEHIERYLGLAGGSHHADDIYIRFLEAVIRERFDPRRAVQIYGSILSTAGHELTRVVHNNLAALKCREDDALCALEHARMAAEGAPPFLIGLLNYKTILEHVIHLARRRHFPASRIDLEEFESVLRAVTERLHAFAEAERDLPPAQAEPSVPGEELAALIHGEELPGLLGLPCVKLENTDLANRCLERAREALGSGAWEGAGFWTEKARSFDPDNPVVSIEANRLRELSAGARYTDEENRKLAEQDLLMARLYELEKAGKYAEAIRQASLLMANAHGEETLSALLAVSDRLRRKLGERHMDEGRLHEEADPELAIRAFRFASRIHSSLDSGAQVQEALLRWPVARRAFDDALGAKHFDMAAECLRRLGDLACTADLQRELQALREGLGRERAEHELQLAVEAAGRNNLHLARRLAISAEARHPQVSPRAHSLLEELNVREVDSLRDEVLSVASSGEASSALDRIRRAPPVSYVSEEMQRLQGVVTRLARQDSEAKFRGKLINARLALDAGELSKARELLEEAAAIDELSPEVASLRLLVERATALARGRKAVAEGRLEEAVEALVPLLRSEPEALAALSQAAAAQVEESMTGARGRRLARRLEGALELLRAGCRRKALKLLEKISRTAPYFTVAELVAAAVLAPARRKLDACREALERDEWRDAEIHLKAVVREWASERPPAAVRTEIRHMNRMLRSARRQEDASINERSSSLSRAAQLIAFCRILFHGRK
jgi:tetratricopeptide (TPR) repeat protein